MPLYFPILCGVVLAIGSVLVWKGRNKQSLPGCGTGSACDDVTRGRWSRLGKVSVAYLGWAVYLLMFCASVGSVIWGKGKPPLILRTFLATTSLLAIGAGIWFVLLQAFIIRRWCLWCVSTHIAAFATGALALSFLSDFSMWLSAGIAGVFLTALVLGQVLLSPKLYAVVDDAKQTEPLASDVACQNCHLNQRSELPLKASAAVSSAHDDGSDEQRIAETPRIERFFHGRVTFNINAWPIIGRRDADRLLVSFFDYTCVQCRELHKHLSRLCEEYPIDIAIVIVPIPLEKKCNPHTCKDDIQHLGACEYARIALAVWLVDPDRFAEIDKWLFDPTCPLGVGSARAKAEELVGASSLKAALSNPVIEQRIKEGIAQYASAGGGMIPQLLFKESMLIGQTPSYAVVRSFVQRNLQLSSSSAGTT